MMVSAIASRVMCACLLLTLTACGTFAPWPRVVHERPSMFGTIAVTDESDGKRAMRFGRNGVTQSVIDPANPDALHFVYARLMLTAIALVPQPRRILVVGLGGGALPVYLHRRFPETMIDVVEIDPAVADVARGYFGYREDVRMRTHVADGRAFLRNAPAAHYDVVLLDAFGSERVPAHLTTLEFLEDVRRVLAPGGLAASNLWSSRYNPIYADMLATHLRAFAEVHVVETRREVNHVVLALATARRLDAAGLAAAARRLATDARLGFDLAELVSAGYRASGDAAAAGRVLRDADRPN